MKAAFSEHKSITARRHWDQGRIQGGGPTGETVGQVPEQQNRLLAKHEFVARHQSALFETLKGNISENEWFLG